MHIQYSMFKRLVKIALTKRMAGWGRGLGASGTVEAGDQLQPRPAGAGPSAAVRPPAAGWPQAPGSMGQHSSLL